MDIIEIIKKFEFKKKVSNDVNIENSYVLI